MREGTAPQSRFRGCVCRRSVGTDAQCRQKTNAVRGADVHTATPRLAPVYAEFNHATSRLEVAPDMAFVFHVARSHTVRAREQHPPSLSAGVCVKRSAAPVGQRRRGRAFLHTRHEKTASGSLRVRLPHCDTQARWADRLQAYHAQTTGQALPQSSVVECPHLRTCQPFTRLLCARALRGGSCTTSPLVRHAQDTKSFPQSPSLAPQSPPFWTPG